MIQGGVRAPWPEAVSQALRSFTQGTVILDPPLFYWADPRHPLWVASAREISDEDPAMDSGEEVVIAEEDRPRYGVLTTQTCDIQEEASPPKKPWVKVAPVVRAEPDWPASLLKQGRYTTFLFWIPRIPEEGVWVADLRLEVPIEKGWLTTRASTAFDGFADDLQRHAFADRLGRLCNRPALATAVVDHILRPFQKQLNRLLKRPEERNRLLAPIDQFAVRFVGDAIAPSVVQLVALSLEVVPDDVKDWYRAWWAEHVSEQDVGSKVLPPDFELLGTLPAAEYRTLIQLDWDYLSPLDEG